MRSGPCLCHPWQLAPGKASHSYGVGGIKGCPPMAADTCPGLSLQDQELESLAAIEAELERVAHKLHELRRG